MVERKSAEDRVEIARCPHCGGLPRPTLLGRTICDRCGGLDVPQPPSAKVLEQAAALTSKLEVRLPIALSKLRDCAAGSTGGNWISLTRDDCCALVSEIERLTVELMNTTALAQSYRNELDDVPAHETVASPASVVAEIRRRMEGVKLGEVMPAGQFPEGVSKYNALHWAIDLIEEIASEKTNEYPKGGRPSYELADDGRKETGETGNDRPAAPATKPAPASGVPAPGAAEDCEHGVPRRFCTAVHEDPRPASTSEEKPWCADCGGFHAEGECPESEDAQ